MSLKWVIITDDLKRNPYTLCHVNPDSKRDTLTLSWFNVGQQTLAADVGPTLNQPRPRVCKDIIKDLNRPDNNISHIILI